MKKQWAILLAVIIGGVAVHPATALTIGENITIPDGQVNMTGSSAWWGRLARGQGLEDQEGEPNAATYGQIWDLEAMFLDGDSLFIVGGYDFATVTGDRTPGSVFLDTNGDVGTGGAANNYGYDFAMTLDFANYEYNLYALDGSAVLANPTVVDESTPWRLASGGVLQNTAPLPFAEIEGVSGWQYATGLPNSEFDDLLVGDDVFGHEHTVFGVDLGFISGPLGPSAFTAHFTMRCGNDNLMGYHRPFNIPDGGTTSILLGIAFCGLGLLRHRLT